MQYDFDIKRLFSFLKMKRELEQQQKITKYMHTRKLWKNHFRSKNVKFTEFMHFTDPRLILFQNNYIYKYMMT